MPAPRPTASSLARLDAIVVDAELRVTLQLARVERLAAAGRTAERARGVLAQLERYAAEMKANRRRLLRRLERIG